MIQIKMKKIEKIAFELSYFKYINIRISNAKSINKSFYQLIKIGKKKIQHKIYIQHLFKLKNYTFFITSSQKFI